jgi:hypothetical protein
MRKVSMLEKLYTYAATVYFDFIRDPIVAAVRCLSRDRKTLILDMDWYRWALDEKEIRDALYCHPEISPKAVFLRIKREQIFDGRYPKPEFDLERYKECVYSGYNLWGICKATIICGLGTYKIDTRENSHRDEINKIFLEAARAIDNLDTLFNRLKPDTVFLFQGGFFDSRCIVEVARRYGINAVGVERSMIGGLVVMDNLTGQIINRHSLALTGAELLETWAVSSSERKQAFNVWKSRLAGKTEDHKTGGIDKAAEIEELLAIPDGKKVLLLLAQVRTDSSVVLDSPIYQDPVDMIEDTAGYLRGVNDTVLVIRLHPKEFLGSSPRGAPYDRMTYRCLVERGIDKLPNVRIAEDPRFNTYTLMDMASAGITINSQAGFEMCLLGKPVMVCGNAFYANKGFTVDLGHRAALEAMLDFLLNKAVMTEEQQNRALDLLHFLYTRHLFDHGLSGTRGRIAQIFLDRPAAGWK